MEEGRWNKWIGKKVYIILKNKRQYTGKIIDVSLGWVSLIDKYGKNVDFNEDEVEVIQEEK